MKFKIKNARLAFPELWKAKAFQEGQDPKFSASFLMEKNDPQIAEIKKIIQTVATEKWGAKAAAVIKSIGADKMCLRDGDLKEKYDGFPGMMYIAAKSKVKPGVFGRNREPLAEDSGIPYGGCYVNAMIDIYAFHHAKGGDQVNATLLGVQFVKDGDAFTSSRPATEDDFDIEDTGEGSADSFV